MSKVRLIKRKIIVWDVINDKAPEILTMRFSEEIDARRYCKELNFTIVETVK